MGWLFLLFLVIRLRAALWRYLHYSAVGQPITGVPSSFVFSVALTVPVESSAHLVNHLRYLLPALLLVGGCGRPSPRVW